MGDRALIIVTDGKEYSPTVYLHYGGSRVPDIIERTFNHMKTRPGDVSYFTARLIGLAHQDNPNSPLSLGVFATKIIVGECAARVVRAIRDGEKISEGMSLKLENYSHGDAGVIVVDCDNFTCSAYGGYYKLELPDLKELADKS